ncbi:hypothetical protein ACFE04_029594 [Oxalis oulophora]
MDSVSASPKSMDDLPEDIVQDIFHRLPIKTLGRCMCVKKQWLFRIKRMTFMAANDMIKSESNRFSLLWSDKTKGFETYTDNRTFKFHSYLDLPKNAYEYENRLSIASCNGLIFLLNNREATAIARRLTCF